MRTAREARPCTESIPHRTRLENLGVDFDVTVVAFAEHKRNKQVGFSTYGEHYKYIDPATKKLKRAKGITKILKGAFYADYKPNTTTISRPASRGRGEKRKTTGYTRGGGRRRPRKAALTAEQKLAMHVADDRVKGITLGNIVHSELCAWARAKSNAEWRKTHQTPNMYTVKIIRTLKMIQIEPLYGEWPVFSDWGIATGIDIVGASAQYGGKLVLIEVKTGYEGYFTRGNAGMTRSPMKRVLNSPMNQAFLQCLTARAILEYDYGISGVIGIVLHVTSKGVDVHPIPDLFLKRQRSIYNQLKQYVLVENTTSRTAIPRSSLTRVTPQKTQKRRRNTNSTTTIEKNRNPILYNFC